MAELGNPLRITLTVGKRGNATQARRLLESYLLGAVLADHNYYANALLAFIWDTTRGGDTLQGEQPVAGADQPKPLKEQKQGGASLQQD
ncbi:hypothetical protein [Rufibacter aurantiacus]|uniref:hypothetical protein n=1 Tax=Rufibacter aurantiacus TaxID=2817374 RepID=UPI001B30D993|nr:hypothetical protein [Rufibacter aurantiacus]